MRKAAIALLAGLALTACQKTPGTTPAPLQKVTLAFTYQPQSALVHIAVAKGYFTEENLEIQPEMHTHGKAALQALLDNKADIATAAETPIMFSILKGEKIRVLANILASNTNNGVVARRDSGIARVKDLKGKRVGYTPGTTSDFFLSSLLSANGLARTEVLNVDLNPGEMQDAMLKKQVDAVSTWNYPISEIYRALGTNGLMLVDKDIYTETFNLVAQQKYVEKNPLVIQKLLRALIKAEDYMRKYPDDAQTIMTVTTQSDKRLVREVWDKFQFKVGLNQVLLLTLEDETRWAISNKLTDRTQMPDYLSYVYFDGLMAVQPDAIHIKR